MTTTRRTGGLNFWILISLVILMAGGAAWMGMMRPTWWRSLFWGSSASKATPKNLVLERAIRAPFLISLSVQGNLDSRKNATLTSLVEGTTTIISLVPEGTWVTQGEVVCELDSASLREQAKQQEITFTQAGAALAQSKESLEIQKRQNESDIAASQLAWALAQLDLESFERGQYPQQQKQLSGNVALANEELLRANESYQFTIEQVKKGYRTQNDLEAARLAVKQAELKLQGAKEELTVLTDFTYRRTIAELQANAKEFEMELERVRLKARSALTQVEKDVEAKRLTHDVEKERLDRLQNQIEACTLRAPQDGEVVYANMSSSSRRSSEPNAIEEGATVRERQAIINLPDITQMKVDCRIHESLIGAIRKGLRCRIRVDAYPDEIYSGEIAHVSSVPMSGSWPNMDLREYATEVHLLDGVDKVRRLRPGLTAQVEVLVDSRPNVLQAPVQSVVTVADRQIAFVFVGDRVERRLVKVGASNQSHLEILDGVAEGERVVLNPRTQFSDEIAALVSEWNAEKSNDEQLVEPAPVVAPAGMPVGAPPAAAAAPASAAGGANGNGGGDPAAIFASQDKNGDGKISREEASDRMKARFDELDKDRDGMITLAEFTAGRRPAGRPADGAPAR